LRFREPSGNHCSIYTLFSPGDAYHAERDRLEARRNEPAEATVPELIDPKRTGLVATWDTGDGVVRRELPATLFLDI
jgi:hypothetical protein